ncbi:unnamed protein product [Caenorhabditis auriculariae]|uniref:Uncharacterized protein n=1 Tax=Caenorhabditis auriculariae TaxID=2777116 RepID=A0A8S1HPE1_9PELO|nr:unnamed protein product [Caenorhabditis auriculariae]
MAMLRGIASPGLGMPTRQQYYDDEPYQANAAQLRPFATHHMERRESGTLIPISQRSLATSTPFGSAPTSHSIFGSPMPTNSPRKMPQQPLPFNIQATVSQLGGPRLSLFFNRTTAGGAKLDPTW